MAASCLDDAVNVLRLVIEGQGITVEMRMTPNAGGCGFTGMVRCQRRIAVTLGTVAGAGCTGRAAAA
jgi:hypothetical protein